MPLLPEQVKGAMDTFHRDITEPTVEFTCAMRRSTSSYHFAFIEDPKVYGMERPELPPPGKGIPVFPDDLDHSEVLDIESHRTLKVGRVEPNEDGSFGNRVMTVDPALYRR